MVRETHKIEDMKTFKNYLLLILTSAVATLVLVLIMLKVTMDFQLLLFIGSLLFFVAGYLNSSTSINPIISSLVITVIYLTLFSVLVLNQLPGLYFFIPIYYLACFLGLTFKFSKKLVGISITILIPVMLFLAINVIPKNIKDSLTLIKSEPLPNFELTDVNGNHFSSNDLKGKVVVMDFFGTWCAPCIKELPELQKVQEAFENNNTVVIYVINADIGGDTPQKFEQFINHHDYNFNFVYDHESKLYKQLNLAGLGLPALLIVDQNQTIKMLHMGYNTAETTFKEDLIKTIQGLL